MGALFLFVCERKIKVPFSREERKKPPPETEIARGKGR